MNTDKMQNIKNALNIFKTINSVIEFFVFIRVDPWFRYFVVLNCWIRDFSCAVSNAAVFACDSFNAR